MNPSCPNHNLKPEKNTGKSLKEGIQVVQNQNLKKHREILKNARGFSHGFTNLMAYKSLKSDAGSAANPEDLIQKRY